MKIEPGVYRYTARSKAPGTGDLKIEVENMGTANPAYDSDGNQFKAYTFRADVTQTGYAQIDADMDVAGMCSDECKAMLDSLGVDVSTLEEIPKEAAE